MIKQETGWEIIFQGIRMLDKECMGTYSNNYLFNNFEFSPFEIELNI